MIRALRQAVWGWSWWLGEPLMMLVLGRLSGICARMERLAARFEAGRLGQHAVRPVAAPDAAARQVAALDAAAVGGSRSGRVARIWPYGFGWLIELKTHHAALYTHRLRAVLERPEMVALLVAAPQAALILRPLCRMLAIERAVLRPRPAGAPVEIVAEKVVRKRVRPKRAPFDAGRIPLPRGVLSAARRQGYGKV